LTLRKFAEFAGPYHSDAGRTAMTKFAIKQPAAVVAAKRAIIQIGTGGRGFIVSAGEHRRYIITAAHCLPHFPEPHLANSANELSYPDILSALGKPKRKVWAELVEFNSVSDFAVFGAPDSQTLWEEYEQYEGFTEHTTMRIGKSTAAPPPLQFPDFDSMAEADLPAWRPLDREIVEAPAWMLSLDGQWLRCMVRTNGRFLTATQGGQHIKSGMSGSPIINDDGAALGLVVDQR
jgi:S1-C subfamily serine protease